jgi:hypothetical protein
MSHVFTHANLGVLNFIANIISPIIHFLFIWDLATYIFYIYLKQILHKL